MSIEIMQQVASGSPISTATVVVNEVPGGTKNGTNDDFTLANTPETGTLALYLRGLRLKETDSTDGYTRSGLNITLGSAVSPPTTTPLDSFLADYRKA